MSDLPYVVNPEAIGDPDATPVVQASPGLAALLEDTRCGTCGLINHAHEPGCEEG